MSENYFETLSKFKINNDNLIRIGSIGDGGYYVDYSLLSKSDLLFSGGISSNVEFEFDVFRMNEIADIIMVDPTVSRLKLFIKGILRIFLNKSNKLKYLMNTMMFAYLLQSKRCKHISKWLSAENKLFSIISAKYKNICLKLDIEGSEYDLLDEIILNKDKFNHLIFEFHDLDKKGEQLMDFISKISNSFDLVFVEPNWAGGSYGNKFPKLIEVTLLKK